jgi:hypothetical protein
LAPGVDLLTGERAVSPQRPAKDDLDGARGLAYGSLIGAGTWLLALVGLALLLGGCSSKPAAAWTAWGRFEFPRIYADKVVVKEWQPIREFTTLAECQAWKGKIDSAPLPTIVWHLECLPAGQIPEASQ